MLALCLVWGLQQVVIKLTAPDVSSLLQVSIRSGVAALLVWLVGRFVLRERWLSGVLPAALLVGGLFGLEFVFVAEGLNRTSASHMSVFLYTAPLWAAVGLHLRLPEERLDRRQWVGIGIAFLGIVIAFLGPGLGSGALAFTPQRLLGDALALLAGISWGLTTVVIRVSRLSEAPATQTLFAQLSVGFVVLVVATLVMGEMRFASTPVAWASLGFQSIVVAFASFLVWFWLLRRYFAAELGVLSLLTPLFGVAFGVLLLGEPLTAAFVIGALLVLVGLLVVNAQGWLPLLRLRRA